MVRTHVLKGRPPSYRPRRFSNHKERTWFRRCQRVLRHKRWLRRQRQLRVPVLEDLKFECI